MSLIVYLIFYKEDGKPSLAPAKFIVARLGDGLLLKQGFTIAPYNQFEKASGRYFTALKRPM